MATARGVATGGAWGSRPQAHKYPLRPTPAPPPPKFRIIPIKVTRGAESWWGCSDSETGLLIDSDSGSDSDLGSDAKYKINNTLIVERVSAVEARKRNVTFPIDFGFHSFGRKILIRVISHTSRIASAPQPQKELRLPGHLFVQIMFVDSWSSSIASTASCLSRDRRSYRSSLIADKSRSTLICVTGSAASAWLQSRIAVG